MSPAQRRAGLPSSNRFGLTSLWYTLEAAGDYNHPKVEFRALRGKNLTITLASVREFVVPMNIRKEAKMRLLIQFHIAIRRVILSAFTFLLVARYATAVDPVPVSFWDQ
jgi:hypothetical protein